MYKEDLVLNDLQWLICHKSQPTKQAKEYNLSKYLPIAGGEVIVPYLFLKTLVRMQTASSRIGTRVADSIFYDDNRYTKRPPPFFVCMC